MKRPRTEWTACTKENGCVDILTPPRTFIATSAAVSSSSKDSTRTNASRDALRSAMAGAMAGIFSRTMTAPIERVKLVLQLQRVSPVATKNKSAWNVCHQIYSTEGGLRAFWRGNSPNVIRQAGASALNFMFMDAYKAIISPILNSTLAFPSNRSNETRKKRRKIVSAFLSGGLAGGTTTTFLYPFEFMRTRLALDVGPSRMYPNGMRDVFLKIINTDGIRGIYQGYGIALTGVVIYRALHLGGYDACKTELLHRRGNKRDSRISIGEQFAIAQIVSIAAGTFCYPIDSVRRRLMMQAGQPVDARQYANSMDAFQKILAKEGVKGFYLGLGPNIIRSVAGALMLVSYDFFREGLQK
eukprot:CAMPEP_0116142850 /NCGR_PEP_ID=MMETSP0329-20121206/15127_1 /TAXON_ID=697910 /ORGANISM="Pseudo-nitzschia arenysensis, Strain B593" /LENGTH=355 /DNA_ID=CAMNT_0003638111 /DNA_START=94 /DNA_END=1161 /DNA_ORIENTATION=+